MELVLYIVIALLAFVWHYALAKGINIKCGIDRWGDEKHPELYAIASVMSLFWVVCLPITLIVTLLYFINRKFKFKTKLDAAVQKIVEGKRSE